MGSLISCLHPGETDAAGYEGPAPSGGTRADPQADRPSSDALPTASTTRHSLPVDDTHTVRQNSPPAHDRLLNNHRTSSPVRTLVCSADGWPILAVDVVHAELAVKPARKAGVRKGADPKADGPVQVSNDDQLEGRRIGSSVALATCVGQVEASRARRTLTAVRSSFADSASPQQPSSLYASSSSSSDRTLDGSYTMLRSETAGDPFGRWWHEIEKMLLQGQSSNPVAFASAPVGSVIDPRTGRSPTSPSRRKGKPTSFIPRSWPRR